MFGSGSQTTRLSHTTFFHVQGDLLQAARLPASEPEGTYPLSAIPRVGSCKGEKARAGVDRVREGRAPTEADVISSVGLPSGAT
jgi:hypothetical protein